MGRRLARGAIATKVSQKPGFSNNTFAKIKILLFVGCADLRGTQHLRWVGFDFTQPTRKWLLFVGCADLRGTTQTKDILFLQFHHRPILLVFQFL